ncbi:MAG: zinc ribbon domain-containing protein [Clostridia bacterium]|nr:zinc ribbon domain-containing protein [Clostridia bacterium]
MKCPACHEEYDDNMEYCPFCGNDNPAIDEEGNGKFAKVEKEFANPFSEPTKQANEKTLIFENDGGNYTAHFDMDNQREAKAYKELSELDSKKSELGTLSFILGVIGAIIVGISVGTRSLSGGTFVAIAFGILFFFGFLITYYKYESCALKRSQRQMDYFKYKIKQEGGEIVSYQINTRTLTYKQNGQVKTVKFHYHVWESGRHSLFRSYWK